MPKHLIAEVIAIGDEITSGQRLDTNSRWISQKLGDLGVRVAFHSAVGDDLSEGITVLKNATSRADIVVTTGGIGPTADDLTRQVIAAVAGVELQLNEDVVQHIRGIFARYNREMPENNSLQAYFPVGSTIIVNPEGTAPGIQMPIQASRDHACTVFSLPGVPYEMKEMWLDVDRAIGQLMQQTLTTYHHVIHCFGAGESQIEQMLPDLVNRDRIPRVGITASKATISLRITAMAETKQKCIEQIQPTIETIHRCLGDLVFGENSMDLPQVVCELLAKTKTTISIADFGFGGTASQTISQMDRRGKYLIGSIAMGSIQLIPWSQTTSSEIHDALKHSASRVRREFHTDIGLAIGPVEKQATQGTPTRYYDVVFSTDAGTASNRLDYGGHSGLRAERTVKQILNTIRLYLLRQATGSDS
jgi:nicotinamide-nucleotide amidase